MGTVTVEINGRPYQVGCADGQEERVRQLSRQFDEHVKQVAGDVGHVGELRLFLMAALLVSDELADIRSQFNRIRAEQTAAPTSGGGGKSDGGGGKVVDTSAAAKAINAAADRIEKLLLDA
jgi:cell division protein ZapA